MAKSEKRIPQKGDQVTADGHKGAFVIYSVDGGILTAELRRIGSDFALSSIPWDELTFIDEPDEPIRDRRD
jgi:hypothetical protein